jgi:SulP family sulfate permease
MFSAIRRTINSKPSLREIQSNILAGLSVGIIALPLSMGLAIASGVPPQQGLYTAIVAGIIIALTGGSKVNISGPTAAFVVILLPIVQQFGLGGLLISGFMAGIILIIFGLARLGGLIQIVPYPVTVGFTTGIAVVIATLQLKDILGLNIADFSGDFIHKLQLIFQALPTLNWHEAGVGLLTLVTLFWWRSLESKIPPHLIGLIVGSGIAWLANLFLPNFEVATIGSSFHYVVDGIVGNGIPPFLPEFTLPWNFPDKTGHPIGLSFELIRSLMGAAFAIAILGALESLLCAVVADGMSGKTHNPNDELIGQGIGNLIVPFFGGLPATAAIARTAANVRAGGTLPLSSIVHSVFIIASILALAPLLAYVPMAAIAALLLLVAWNMSEAKHFIRIIRVAPNGDKATLLTCFSLTVMFDMEIAVAVGLGLAAALFIRRSIALTGLKLIDNNQTEHPRAAELPNNVLIYDVNGAMFFGSAQKALSVLTHISKVKIVVLDMSDVTMLDMTAMVAMESIAENFKQHGIKMIINNLDLRMILKLRSVGIGKEDGNVTYSLTIDDAITSILDESSLN